MSQSPKAIKTPTRDRLTALLGRSNRLAWGLLFLEACICIWALGTIIDLDRLTEVPILTAVAIGIALFPRLMSLAGVLVESSLPISELAVGRRIGRYTRAELEALLASACRGLGIDPKGVTLSIRRDTSANAFALAIDSLVPKSHGRRIYVNRALLHLLNSQELLAVIAHELGHIFLWYKVWDRALILHLIFYLTMALSVVSFGLSEEVTIFSIIALIGAHQWLGRMLFAHLDQPIEFLCDDSGIRATCVKTHVMTELKLALRGEIESGLFLHVLKEGKDALTLDQIQQVHAEALTFEATSEERSKERARALQQEQAKRNSEISLRGFLEHLGFGGGGRIDEQLLEEELKAEGKKRSKPRLAWPKERLEGFTMEDIKSLVSLIESDPGAPLVHGPGDRIDPAQSHPSHRERILYAVRNYGAGGAPHL